MSTVTARRSVSVRLEGGLGDHILGMRVLRFIHDHYPDHEIVAYSDSAGHSTQLAIASMSPFVSRVVLVGQRAPPKRGEVGKLDNIRAEDMQMMLAHDVFIDAYGRSMFARASIALDVPIFEILAKRPELRVAPSTLREASELLAPYAGAKFVGFNMTKYGAAFLERNMAPITYVLHRLLEDPMVVVLNMFTSRYTFNHWPQRERVYREETAAGESGVQSRLCVLSERIVPCVDLPIETIVALLKRCRYFIGLDNGIKHLAWALDLPHTFFHTERPSPYFVMRWMPDLHRMLLFNCANDSLDRHIAEAKATLRSSER